MQSVFIVTDSTADLPENIAREYGITVVPLKVIFSDNEVFLDGVDIKTAEFYRRQVEKKEFSTSSQPTPLEFREVYQKLAAQGASSIISVHISSGMSGTAQSAVMAAKTLPELDIEVVDSKFVSMALGIIAVEAARLARQGRTKQEIMPFIRDMIEKLQVFFVVDTLEYLARGGRIGKAQAFLGTLLHIRPILYITQGLIHPYEKVRGKTKAIDRLAEIVVAKAAGRPVICSFVHGLDPQGMEQLYQKTTPRLNIVGAPIKSELGAVVGTHVGPGVLGVIFCPQGG